MGRLRLIAAMVLFIVSLTMLGWGVWPTLNQPQILLLTPTISSAAPAGPLLPGRIPSSPETWKLTLDYPPWIRPGDSYVIRLTLDTEPPAAGTEGAGVGTGLAGAASPNTANPDKTYNVIAEARLDIEGMEVRPSTGVIEPLVAGESLAYRWIVRTAEAGTFPGTAWLVLVFVDRASGAQTRMPISAQPMQIQATSLLGLAGGSARMLGGLGMVAAALLGLPFASVVLRRFRHGPRPKASVSMFVRTNT